LIDVYVKQKYVFLALKLQKDKSAGDLAPIVVTLNETAPCLPLRLTQLAAKPDMPIVAWVLGQHRAIPKNFLHVVLNDSVIDYLAGGSNYKTVVSKAVDQASGHAFTTEYAQAVAKFGGKFLDPNWKVGDLDGITEPGAFLLKLLEKGYPRTTQMQNLIRKYIPKPDAYKTVSDQEFYSCLQSSGGYAPCDAYKAAVAKQTFDAKAFAKDVQEFIVAPLAEVQKAFTELPYLTRLYTTVSPEEMNKDPIFAFNGDLADVNNTHSAKGEPICDAGKTTATKVKMTYEDGHVLTVDIPAESTNTCYFGGGSVGFGKGEGPLVASGGQPAAKVQVLDESGAALDIDPTVADLVDSWLSFAEAGKPSLSADQRKQLPPITWDATKTGAPISTKTDAGSTAGSDIKGGASGQGGGGASSGCSASGAGTGGAAFGVLLLFTTLWISRRRRAA